MKIAVLDSPKEFPNLMKFVESELYEYEVIHSFDDDESLQREANTYFEDTGETLPIYSSNPDKVNKILNTISNVHPYFITLEKLDFKEMYESFKDLNDSLFVPKILISSNKPIDLIEVSNLFSKASSKTIKYINGSQIPTLLKYEGMETFEYIATLTSGVLVPATKYDILSSDTNIGIPINKKYILQKFEDENIYQCLSYSVKTNEQYNILWTDIITEKIPSLVKDLKLPTGLDCNFYCEIEVHNDTFFINKVIQGIHPFIIYPPKENGE